MVTRLTLDQETLGSIPSSAADSIRVDKSTLAHGNSSEGIVMSDRSVKTFWGNFGKN